MRHPFLKFASLALGLPVYDSQAGAKVFSARAVEGPLFQQPFLSRWLFSPLGPYVNFLGGATGLPWRDVCRRPC